MRGELSRATPFEIELSIIRDWEMLQNTPPPKWKWFREEGTELWQHRLACMCAWSSCLEWNPWTELIVKGAHSLETDYQLFNVIGSQNCLAEDEKVRMWDGSVKPIREVQVGDKLLGDNRDCRTVLERFEGEAELYEVLPKVGRSWRCTENHRLVVKRTSEKKPHGRNKSGIKRKRKKARAKVGDVTKLTVEEWLQKSPDYRSRNMQFTAEANDDNWGLEIEPRLYGLWLGDGSKDQPELTIAAEEREVRDYVLSCHSDIGIYRYKDRCPRYRLRNHPAFSALAKESGATGEKRVARRAFRMNRYSRLLLLAGLIDSDGHLSNNCQFVFTQKNYGLVQDVEELAQGLGFRCNVMPREYFCRNSATPDKPIECWQVSICGDIDRIPTLRKRRAKGAREDKRRKHGCTGIDVQHSGRGRYVGITVDGNHNFCLDDYTVVSNSSKTQTMAHLMVQLLIEAPEKVGIYIGSPYREATQIGIWGNIKLAFRDVCHQLGWNASDYVRESMGVIALEESDRAGWIRVVSVDKVGMLQGKKPVYGGRLYLLIEESGAFDKNPGIALWDVLQNLCGQEGFKALSTCNFKNVFGLDGKLCAPRRGSYADLDPDEDQGWESVRNGFTLRLDGHRSPNHGLKRKKFPYLVGDDDIDNMVAAGFGEGSAKYMEQIRSFPVTGISQFTVTTMSKLQAGKVFAEDVYLARAPERWAFADPAFGGDAFRVAVAEIKWVQTGQPVIVPVGLPALDIQMDREWRPEDIQLLDSFRGAQNEVRVGDKFTPEMQGAMQCADLLRQYGIPANRFGFDASMRASVQRAMDSLLGQQALAMDYIGAAPDEEMPSGVGNARNLYANFITYLWFLAADLCESYAVREGDQWLDGFDQMSSRLWDWSGQRRKMESKSDYKDRNAQKSPDEADAIVGLLYLIYTRSGHFGPNVNKTNTDDLFAWLEGRHTRPKRRRLGQEDLLMGTERRATGGLMQR